MSSSAAGTVTESGTVRYGGLDGQACEAVERPRTGLMFVGVKTSVIICLAMTMPHTSATLKCTGNKGTNLRSYTYSKQNVFIFLGSIQNFRIYAHPMGRRMAALRRLLAVSW